MINRVLITLSVALISFGVKAHQPDLSSTLLVEQGENEWVLQVRSSLTAFEYEIEKHFGESSYTSPEEFQELVINYLKENISIKSNKTKGVVLENGIVKLGHETAATFEVVGMPATIQSLQVTNTSFTDIARNQSALIVLKEGFSKDQFVLNNNNQHTAKLKVSNSSFVLATPIQKTTKNSVLILGVLSTIAFAVAYFFYKNKHNYQNTRFALNP